MISASLNLDTRSLRRPPQKDYKMYLKKTSGPRSVTTANGSILSLDNLPPVGTLRWVASRKATVVRAVLYGLISQDKALELYNLSIDEFQSWVQALHDHGETALKTTQSQKYRQPKSEL